MFTKSKNLGTLKQADLKNILFSSEVPFWCSVGYQKKPDGSTP